jgi:hypothetical protein
VSKTRWHPELLVVVFAQLYSGPLPKGWRAFSDIHSHIKYRAAHHAHQFALRLVQLVVQSAQYAFDAATVVVLHEVHI